jgi:signal transduction histidine kinase
MSRVRATLLPELARRHLDGLQGDFRLAIVAGSEVIYAAPGTDARAIAAAPDVAVPIVLRGEGPGRGRRGGIMSVDRAGRPRPWDARTEREPGPDGWWFVAQHRAGSLDQAVSSLRARNLSISFGILLLMGVAVGIIASNARKAERLGRQQVEFVASVSHEMRTPVAAIEVAARNLEDGLVHDPQRVRTYGSVIRTEAARLAETVERVLRVAALDAGRGTDAVTDLALKPLVEEAVVAARRRHPEATVDTAFDADTDLVARGDAGMLRSCVQNLLDNALKYGGAPGWAGVRVERTDGPAAEARITVADRGPGIDARDLPHVFEPFYRGRLAVEKRLPGNGLGLHIVKRSMEAMGGRVSVRSEGSTGMAFTLHVPLAAAGGGAAGPGAAGPSGNGTHA